jgi:hypothetical protein
MTTLTDVPWITSPQWVAKRNVLSPKPGVGRVDLYWQGPNDRALCGRWSSPLSAAAAHYDTADALAEALAQILGPAWRTWKEGVQLVELWPAVPPLPFDESP